MKLILTWTFILGTFLNSNLFAQTHEKDDANYYLFAGELLDYLNTAREAAHGDEAQLDLLTDKGRRVAITYFENIDTETKPQLDSKLGEVIRANSDIEEYFIQLGNAFILQAQALISKRNREERKIRVYSTTGGALLGAVGAGFLLYFKGVTAKTALLSAGAVVGLGALGYWGVGPAVYTFWLPADLSVRNSKDFMARYPSGQDFIEDLDSGSRDLAMAMEDFE